MNFFSKIKNFFGGGSARQSDSKRTGYNASKQSRLNPWRRVSHNINDILRMERLPVSDRVRHLVRNFPFFCGAAKRICDYVTGPGIRFQSQIRRPDGALDRRLNQKIEDEVKFWMDEADVSGKMHFYEMQALLKKTEAETGDFVVIRVNPRDRKRRFPFYALQAMDPDWLDSSLSSFPSKNQETAIDQGIEFDVRTGRAIAYHFTDPDGWGKPMRVLAQDVIHGFKVDRAGQIRGISPFVAAVLVAADLGMYLGAHIDAAKMEAKWLGFVTKLDQSDIKNAGFNQQHLPFSGERLPDDEIYDEIENAIIEILRPGEDIKFATPTRGKIGLTPFVKICLQMVSIVTDVPYEILSGDYDNVNFSTLNTSRRDFRHVLKPQWARFIRQFCRPAVNPLYDQIAISGHVHMPGYFNNPFRYIQDSWQPPGMDPVDVVKEANANAMDFQSGVNSPQNVARERGLDFEEVIIQLEEANNLAAQHGVMLNYGGKNTASAAQNDEPEENDDE